MVPFVEDFKVVFEDKNFFFHFNRMKNIIAVLHTGYHRDNTLCDYVKSPSRPCFYSVEFSGTIDNFILLCVIILAKYLYIHLCFQI